MAGFQLCPPSPQPPERLTAASPATRRLSVGLRASSVRPLTGHGLPELAQPGMPGRAGPQGQQWALRHHGFRCWGWPHGTLEGPSSSVFPTRPPGTQGLGPSSLQVLLRSPGVTSHGTPDLEAGPRPFPPTGSRGTTAGSSGDALGKALASVRCGAREAGWGRCRPARDHPAPLPHRSTPRITPAAPSHPAPRPLWAPRRACQVSGGRGPHRSRVCSPGVSQPRGLRGWMGQSLL